MKYNHVLALYPYVKDSTATMGIFPPTGLEYIATNIKDHVGKVTLLDLRYEKQFQDIKLLSEFIKNEIDLVCISITWNSQFNPICVLIRQLPDDVTTVVGGYKATEEVEYLFERCQNIDIIVRGEGEDTIREVVNGLGYNDILGLSYRKNGTVIHNDPRPLPDISAAAFPDRSLRRHDYHWIQSGARITDLTFDTVLTSRGCPYNCKFCTCSLNPLGQKRKYAERPLDSVIEELKNIAADVVMFSDDNFFIHGYFIYGNIGETEEEMVYIARFAKEMRLDTISFQKLRIEKYSPLKEIVEETPGYYFKRIGGAVYSDKHDRKDFKRIRNRIRSDFYDFQQIRQILRKVHRSGLLTNSELMQILTRLPNILFRLLKRKMKKK